MFATHMINVSPCLSDDKEDIEDPVLGWYFQCRSKCFDDVKTQDRTSVLTRYSGGPVYYCADTGRIINNPVWRS